MCSVERRPTSTFSLSVVSAAVVQDFDPQGDVVADTKIIFIAFAIEDERQRDFLKGQTLSPRAPYEFVDMSVKEPYDTGWKDKVRTRIRRSAGVIVLVSKNSLTSTGQKWEIQCAKDERKPIRGIWAYKDDRTSLAGVDTVAWTDQNIIAFIDSL
jgi:hypothetical protein